MRECIHYQGGGTIFHAVIKTAAHAIRRPNADHFVRVTFPAKTISRDRDMAPSGAAFAG
jgi:hypothetical protein